MFSLMNVESHRIATLLEGAPAWSRLGLTSLDSGLRKRAADQLGTLIAAKLFEAEPVTDQRQMSLFEETCHG